MATTSGTARALYMATGTNWLELTVTGTTVDGVTKLDCTTVQSAIFRVLRGDGTISTWSTQVVSASAAEVVLQHLFTPADRLDPTDPELEVTPLLTDASGSIYAGDPYTLRIVP
jgi:hypothetical protein